MGVEKPMDNVGLGPTEGPLKSPHGLNKVENDPNTEKNVVFFMPWGILVVH